MRKRYTNESVGFLTKRKRRIRKYVFKGIFLAVAIIILTIMCANRERKSGVCYTENSNVDYKVYLKENEFYSNDYVEKDKQYIASLIDYIVADFNYELEIYEKDIEYDYKYRIDAEVNVAERDTSKSIYSFEEELVKEKSFSHNSNSEAKINEKINIDYNKYNDLIKKFVSVYEINESECTLTINMCISINGTTDNFTRDESDEYIVSLEIPLTTKTMAINLNSNLVGCEETLIACETKEFCWLKVIIAFAVLLEIMLIIKLIRYITKSRTPEDAYKLELTRILNNYGSYIQKVSGMLDFERYQIMKIETFNDLLEIRDTIQEPIMMYEVKNEKKAYFMTLSKTNILYIFELKVNKED